jgi:hypothetical protein
LRDLFEPSNLGAHAQFYSVYEEPGDERITGKPLEFRPFGANTPELAEVHFALMADRVEKLVETVRPHEKELYC